MNATSVLGLTHSPHLTTCPAQCQTHHTIAPPPNAPPPSLPPPPIAPPRDSGEDGTLGREPFTPIPSSGRRVLRTRCGMRSPRSGTLPTALALLRRAPTETIRSPTRWLPARSGTRPRPGRGSRCGTTCVSHARARRIHSCASRATTSNAHNGYFHCVILHVLRCQTEPTIATHQATHHTSPSLSESVV